MLGFDWDTDPHRGNPDVHFRLFHSKRDNDISVICVQDFDYRDYDRDGFIGPWAWSDEAEANEALGQFKKDIATLLGLTTVYVNSQGRSFDHPILRLN